MKDTKKITCPEHPKHEATLYTWPHKNAGIWECTYDNEEYSDSCEHDPEFYEIEDAVEDYYDPGNYYGHGQREYTIYVCGQCECAIPLDVADPKEDAYEAMIDAQIDEMREYDL